MALFISISTFASGSETSLHRDITRFIYKFHNLLTISDFKSNLKNEISFYYPNLEEEKVDMFFRDNYHFKPIKLVSFLEKVIQESNSLLRIHSSNLNDITLSQWNEYIKEADLYIICTSENGHKSESSFGHLAFLYDFKNTHFFDNVVTFFAINFSDPETGKTPIGNYLKGAFGELQGRFVNYPFFDALHEYLVVENRIISKYKLNIDEFEREKIDKAIWNTNNSNTKYNFFSKNCATEVMKVLGDVFSISEKFSFRTPAELVRILEREELVSYEGSYRCDYKEDQKVEMKFDKESKYDTALKSYSRKFKTNFSNQGNKFSFVLFQSSRPYNGLSNLKSSLVLLDFTLFYNRNNKLDITFEPFKFKYYFSIFKNMGIKIDLNRLDSRWEYPVESGLYLDFRNIRIETNYQYIIYNYKNIYNFQFHYSNNYLDFMLGKNNFKGKDSLFLGLELFLTSYFSVNLFGGLASKNFGIIYYK